MDMRLKYISYSSLQTFHTCPRKYQLQKLQADATEDSFDESVTFLFGHIVGEGIQLVLQGLPEEKIIFKLFLAWKLDLFAEDAKRMKSFWYAITAVQSFISLRNAGLLSGYELYYHNGIPAVEFSFKISLPEDFYYRGHVDAVLVHSETGEVLVLEVKTSSATTINPAAYKNSAQAVGYSIVLDSLFPSLSSYKVCYLVYKTKSLEFEAPFEFTKTHLQRALWLNELLLDTKTILMYEEAGTYPMRGENCLEFFRECKYFNICTLSTSHLSSPLSESKKDELENTPYTVNLTFEQLIYDQLTNLGVK